MFPIDKKLNLALEDAEVRKKSGECYRVKLTLSIHFFGNTARNNSDPRYNLGLHKSKVKRLLNTCGGI